MQKLLIVEDDVIIAGGVKVFLEGKGYSVDCAFNLADARKALNQNYQLIILDCNLPDGSGLDLCRTIREQSNVPVIFLTALDTEEDMIEGFRAGCDDYIAKPFSVELLNQRIMAVLRRSGREEERSLFSYRELTIDFGKMQVFLNQIPVKLSGTEYKLLELLVKNKGQVMTRDSILERIWDCNENFVDENTLNVHIRRLRQKIETDSRHPQYIITVFGIGYTFGE
ncbi:MAG: response regulator transcription factor [Lachnospiraceae bacterium]|nr:response regulator transcription factor [Lachnospiraceae bacterium]